MIKFKKLKSIIKNVIPRSLLNAYYALRQEIYNRKFDTCSPEAVPIIKEALKKTIALRGDYYEFGVYKGYLLFTAFKSAKELGINNINFYGFDSFEGLPEIRGIDQGWRFERGQYACSIEKVKSNLIKRRVSLSNVFLIKGFYSDVLYDKYKLSKYNFDKARVVFVDCDLYHSTKNVLNFIKPYLQIGTILIMDDWNCFDADNQRGERKALREFLLENPNIKLKQLGNYSWHGTYFDVLKI